jgi:hypothetical protein
MRQQYAIAFKEDSLTKLVTRKTIVREAFSAIPGDIQYNKIPLSRHAETTSFEESSSMFSYTRLTRTPIYT